MRKREDEVEMKECVKMDGGSEDDTNIMMINSFVVTKVFHPKEKTHPLGMGFSRLARGLMPLV